MSNIKEKTVKVGEERTYEELKALAEKCVASEDQSERIAGRQALRALKALVKTGQLGVEDAMRAGARVEEFAFLFGLFQNPQDWMWKGVCREYLARVRGTYSVSLGRNVPEDDAEMADLCAEFAEAGLPVTAEAIAHNASAWKADMKSGYRGDGYFLFTPCGCNDLHLRAEPLVEGADWQNTYMA